MTDLIAGKQEKRLQKEIQDNAKPSECFYIQPTNDKYLWHFTIVGLPESEYFNGVYHGKIVIPQNYPLSPPDVFFFNESGRYSTNTKICLNVTSYHKESWSPAWSMRTIMEAFTTFFHID